MAYSARGISQFMVGDIPDLSFIQKQKSSKRAYRREDQVQLPDGRQEAAGKIALESTLSQKVVVSNL